MLLHDAGVLPLWAPRWPSVPQGYDPQLGYKAPSITGHVQVLEQHQL